jgi:REP element-mobilizing transposase RayT
MIGNESSLGGHRRSIRLRGWDYSSRGIYFVTICAEKKVCLFGQVVDNEMKVNEVGRIVDKVWNSIPDRFPNVQMDSFVVMPNHVHGVIAIMSDGRQGAASSAPTIGRIMRAFKSISAIEVNKASGRKGNAVWQRNYYEHIVRGGDDLDRVRRYIIENPRHWGEDEENPEK